MQVMRSQAVTGKPVHESTFKIFCSLRSSSVSFYELVEFCFNYVSNPCNFLHHDPLKSLLMPNFLFKHRLVAHGSPLIWTAIEFAYSPQKVERNATAMRRLI